MGSVKLGDVAQESRETIENARDLPTVGLEHLTPGVLELERWENNAETTFSKGFKKDQILFGRRRAYLKKAAVASFDGVCSGDITVIEAIPNKIDKRLLPFVVQNDVFFDFAMSRSAGGLSPRVKWKDLKEYEFNLPPIEEQARIADLLWAMNDAKKAYRNLLAATNELVKARFVEMFGNPESNPLNFPVKRFEEICENLDYRRKPITASMRKAGRYPYYGASGVVDYVEDFIFDEDILLISEDGANLRVRSTPIAFSVSGKVWVNNHAHVVKFENKSLQKYIEVYFSLIDISSCITGSAQPKLNQASLNNMLFSIPGHNALERYYQFLCQVDQTKAKISRVLTQTEEFFKTSLYRYFS